MPIQLDLSSLVNAAGALLFALAGVAILVLSHRASTRRGRLVGWLALSFGLTFIIQNLRPYWRDPIEVIWSISALSALTSIPAILLSRDIVAPLPFDARARWRAYVVVAVAIFAIASILLTYLVVTVSTASLTVRTAALIEALLYNGLLTVTFLLILVSVAVHLRSGPAHAPHARRALACLALAFGSWTMFQAVAIGSTPSRIHLLGIAGFSLAALAPLAVAMLVPSGRWPEPRIARNVLVTLAAVALVRIALGVAIPGYDSEFGLYGIIRTIGVVFLAIAVLKYDLLGVPLPRIVVRRGALATGALAIVLIVAQVAQNFLSARYGLLMGGIVAGAFLFAAQPLQRALERGGVGDQAPADHATSPPLPKGHERAYKAAVRLATRAGMTREDELELAHVAESHGIGPVRAHELRDEAEREMRAKGGEP